MVVCSVVVILVLVWPLLVVVSLALLGELPVLLVVVIDVVVSLM